MILETNFLDDLASSNITGIILFFIGMLVLYLFIRFVVRVYIHFSERKD